MRSALFLKGEAEFAQGGDTYRIVLDNEAWLTVEELAPGVSLIDLTHQMLNAMLEGRYLPVKLLTPILAAGLARHHPEIRLDDARAMILSMEQVPVLAALHKAMMGSLPLSKAEDGKAEDMSGNAPRPAGTGKRSSRAGAAPGRGSKPSGKRPRG